MHFLLDFPYSGIFGTPLVKKLFPGLKPEEEIDDEIPVLDQAPVTIVTPRIDQVCGRVFKYYQNFKVEGHSLVGEASSVGEWEVEVHGASPKIRWVSDEVSPGYYNSVRVDNELYQVSALSGCLHLLTGLQIKDIVLVEPDGDHERKGVTSASNDINPLADQYW